MAPALGQCGQGLGSVCLLTAVLTAPVTVAKLVNPVPLDLPRPFPDLRLGTTAPRGAAPPVRYSPLLHTVLYDHGVNSYTYTENTQGQGIALVDAGGPGPLVRMQLEGLLGPVIRLRVAPPVLLTDTGPPA